VHLRGKFDNCLHFLGLVNLLIASWDELKYHQVTGNLGVKLPNFKWAGMKNLFFSHAEIWSGFTRKIHARVDCFHLKDKWKSTIHSVTNSQGLFWQWQEETPLSLLTSKIFANRFKSTNNLKLKNYKFRWELDVIWNQTFEDTQFLHSQKSNKFVADDLKFDLFYVLFILKKF
jgi:hypothetical protein